MSTFWSLWIIILTVGNILACYWLVWWATKPHHTKAAEGEVTGHTWDGLQEYNNPLPRWWLWLFYGTIIFGFVYLALYPGLGSYKGMLGWSDSGQWEQEMTNAEEQYGPIFSKYAAVAIPALAKDDDATRIGQRLYLNYCAQCHGSDAGGIKGFPNLADDDWQWGGSPEQIQATILHGRTAVMPAHEAILGADGVNDVTQYVISMSGREHDSAMAAKGKEQFDKICMACHMPTGVGNPALGAPNLTDKIWLYGSTVASIEESIGKGRTGVMPAHKDFLGTEKSHLLTAYIYSLSD